MKDSVDNIGAVVPFRKGKGRPTKESLRKAKAPVGRPKEDRGRIAEFKARLLGTSGRSVIDKVIKIALDDAHPGQMAALKMCVDRVLPVSLFEKGHGVKPSIQINIVNTTTEQEVSTVDMDISDVEEMED